MQEIPLEENAEIGSQSRYFGRHTVVKHFSDRGIFEEEEEEDANPQRNEASDDAEPDPFGESDEERNINQMSQLQRPKLVQSIIEAQQASQAPGEVADEFQEQLTQRSSTMLST